MDRIVLIGAGGHCLSCIEVIESTGRWELAGLVDAQLPAGHHVSGYKVLGSDTVLPTIAQGIRFALITVGQVGSARLRIRLFEQARDAGFTLPNIFASTALVSKRAQIGEGTIIMHHAIVNNASGVGENCIINTNALIEHSSTIGSHCHVSTGAIVNGDCAIGDRCFVGSGATIKNGIRVCSDTIIGAGAVVVKDISEPGLYFGCPAKKVEK